MSLTAIDGALLEAYRATRYVVLGPEGEIVVRIGETSPALDALLACHGAGTATFVTAWNPRSRAASAVENRAAAARLDTEIEAAGYRCLRQEGRGEGGDWPPEPGPLVLGLTAEQAVALASRYDQNAVVWYVRGQPAVLLFTS